MSTNKRALRKRVVKRKAWNEEMGPKPKSSRKSSLETWNLVEKKCLLEGLKSYGPQKHKLIANLIGSKSEAEVQERIFSLRGAAACDTQSADGINTEVRAPIEKWIHTVSELVHCDEIDYSLEISKALGYIAKYEDFDDEQVHDLSWRNIYTYLSGLAEKGAVGLPTMSDIESLILIELMTDLGTTLNGLDTTPQQQILEHKIQLINAGLGVQYINRAQRSQNAMFMAQALGNEFTGLENLLTDSFSDSSSSLNSSKSKTSEKNLFETSSSTDNDVAASRSNTIYSVNPSNFVHKNGVDLNEHVGLRYTDELDITFIKPKLFTFNPLCIPTNLHNFQLKNV
ncbi:hypothetical protein RRG08_042787 [Elysia crispata]|uniref:Myb-like domain-containing protein n=1 Tax=Elysia crispata TaxID=231223 RepID=A0AAE1CK92_9GAST|nr:hypothetical protein RRG08_042787 [Elysia crispata]